MESNTQNVKNSFMGRVKFDNAINFKNNLIRLQAHENELLAKFNYSFRAGECPSPPISDKNSPLDIQYMTLSQVNRPDQQTQLASYQSWVKNGFSKTQSPEKKFQSKENGSYIRKCQINNR